MDEQEGLEAVSHFTLSRFIENAGSLGILALVCGVAVLILALRCASRRGPRSHAYALFAAAWLGFLPVPLATSFGELPPFLLLITKWGDPRDIQTCVTFAGPMPQPALVDSCAASLLLGLVGSIAALARSSGAGGGPSAASRST